MAKRARDNLIYAQTSTTTPGIGAPTAPIWDESAFGRTTTFDEAVSSRRLTERGKPFTSKKETKFHKVQNF